MSPFVVRLPVMLGFVRIDTDDRLSTLDKPTSDFVSTIAPVLVATEVIIFAPDVRDVMLSEFVFI